MNVIRFFQTIKTVASNDFSLWKEANACDDYQ